jgi:hypothetical protein
MRIGRTRSESRGNERFGASNPGQPHTYEVNLGPDCIHESTKLCQAMGDVKLSAKRVDIGG